MGNVTDLNFAVILLIALCTVVIVFGIKLAWMAFTGEAPYETFLFALLCMIFPAIIVFAMGIVPGLILIVVGLGVLVIHGYIKFAAQDYVHLLNIPEAPLPFVQALLWGPMAILIVSFMMVPVVITCAFAPFLLIIYAAGPIIRRIRPQSAASK